MLLFTACGKKPVQEAPLVMPEVQVEALPPAEEPASEVDEEVTVDVPPVVVSPPAEEKPIEEPIKVVESVRFAIDASAAEQGMFLESCSVEIQDGESVYDVLVRICEGSGLSVDAKDTFGSVYVRGINGLSEKDYGPMSGWMYKVNGMPPNYSADKVKVHGGDEIVWYYVCGM